MDYIFNSPLSLLILTDEEEINLANSYLPFSTGFEIECNRGPNSKDIYFKQVPNIVEVRNNDNEQRYRLHNGINGFITLFLLSRVLKKYSLLNMGSGIHYHIGDNKFYNIIKENQNIINSTVDEEINGVLNQLDSWNYKNNYNSRRISFGHNWIRLNNEFKTFEFRIGEMTFDYNLLVKRIIHANKIIFDWSSKYIRREIAYNKVIDSKIISLYIKDTNEFNRINNIKTIESNILTKPNVSNRTIKLY